MSCFIVEDRTINAIVTYISTESHLCLDLIKERIERKYEINLNTESDRNTLGEKLHQINCAAFGARYREHVDPYYRGFKIELASPIAAIKALTYWLYQVAEEPFIHTEEYKFWDNLLSSIAMLYLQSLPEWEAVKTWE